MDERFLLQSLGPERLQQQLTFVVELDELKGILRRTRLIATERRENSAEHSWHLTAMALVLSDCANAPVDLPHVLKMLIVHDIVEIDAGDTYCYDETAKQDKAQREQEAATRIFGLLPPNQAQELRALWDEFEARATPEAQFANALDRLMPLLHNLLTGGGSWTENSISKAQVLERCRPIQDGSDTLWRVAQSIIDIGVARGYLRP